MESALTNLAHAEADFFKTYIQEIDSAIPFAGISSPSANNDVEKAAVGIGFVAGFVVPAGEAGKAAKIESLTAVAGKLYPKLAEKGEQLHHVVPKYLGGAANGEVKSIPAAYHQLITNEFRRLAPYGQKIQRGAEEVGRILQQVYSKYPLP